MTYPGQASIRDRKTGSCQGLGLGENGEGLLNMYGVSFWGEENVQEL